MRFPNSAYAFLFTLVAVTQAAPLQEAQGKSFLGDDWCVMMHLFVIYEL